MGADQIGLWMAVDPSKVKSIITRSLKPYTKALKNWAEGIHAEPLDDEEAAAILKVAKGLGYDLTNDDELDPKALAAQVLGDYELVRQEHTDSGHRDMTTCTLTFGKRQVRVFYAGEMTWGDEPAGSGYQYIHALWRLGIGGFLWASAEGRKPRKVRR